MSSFRLSLPKLIRLDTDMTVPTLTLSPEATSLINSRDDSPTSSPASNAASSTVQVTTEPATEPSTPSSKSTSSTMDSVSVEQSTPDPSSNAPSTDNPDSTLDNNTLDPEIQIDADSPTSTSSESSTASVDTAIFGALACVGAIVLAITYKKKRNVKGGDVDSNLPDYTNKSIITPDNLALVAVQEYDLSAAMKMSDSCNVDTRPPSTNVSDNVSPFGSARCKVRVSSPVSRYHVSNEPNTEFSDVYRRQVEGSNVVLTFDEVPDTQNSVPQVQL